MVTKTNVGKVGETHPHSSLRSKQRSLVKEPIMTISTHSLINTQGRKIDGLSIRYAESAPRDVSAILLSPWPESLYTFEQMWPRGRDLQKTKLHNLRTAYGNWNHWSRRFRRISFLRRQVFAAGYRNCRPPKR